MEHDYEQIDGVEIFKTGTHNGDAYTAQDLDDMVSAFGSLDFEPPVKAGHSEDKKGMPALGWVKNLRRAGERLVADFTDLPKIVYDAIKDKRYNRVSSEVYWNLDRGGKKYRRALKAVALLGAEIPAVANLKPLHEMFEAHADAVHEGALLTLEYGEGSGNHKGEGVDEMELKELQEAMKGMFETALAPVTTQLGDVTKQLSEEKAAREALELKLKEAAQKSNSDSIEGVIKNLSSENREIDADVLRKQKEAAEKRALEEEEKRKVAEVKSLEEQQRSSRLEQEQRKGNIERLALACRVPALRQFIASFADLATRGSDVRLYDDKGHSVPAISQVEDMIKYVNDNAAKLFLVFSQGDNSDRRELDPSKELDRRTKEYMQRNKGVSYIDAMRSVADEDPALKAAYQATGNRALGS